MTHAPNTQAVTATLEVHGSVFVPSRELVEQLDRRQFGQVMTPAPVARAMMKSIRVTASEIDTALACVLAPILAECAVLCAAVGIALSSQIVRADYYQSGSSEPSDPVHRDGAFGVTG